MFSILRNSLLCVCAAASLCAEEGINPVSQEYQKGMHFFDKGNYKKCVKILKKIIKKNPNVTDLGRIQVQIGKTYEAMKKYKKAFKAYEVIFRKYLEYPNPEEIIEREYQIAEKYSSGQIKKILGMDFHENNKTALEIYDRVIKNAPFGPYAQPAFLKSIHILIKTKQFKEADEKISLFKKAYENSSHLDEIYYLDGYNEYLQIKRSDYDQTRTVRAVEKFRDYLKRYPTGEFYDKAKELLHEVSKTKCENDLKTAEFYLKQGNREAANKYYQSIIKDFPDTEWANEAQKRLLG
ncbi:MAG: outer membrane protein assembly factor BamD [Candidatus Aureabacteria bacterium]|nr:outer membrane protein assembly factor BamD [Candidatus Auribacterota bacterium]